MPRIAVSGSQNSGKSTLINAFLRKFPKYANPKLSYRDLINELKLDINQNASEASQDIILFSIVDNQSKYKPTDNIIFDRCSLDNLMYTFYLYQSGVVSESFVDKSVGIVRNSLSDLDIIFITPYLPHIPLQERENRDIALQFVEEMNQLFLSVCQAYAYDMENTQFLPTTDCPAIILLEGPTVEDRLSEMSLYLNPDGGFYNEETKSLITNIDDVEEILRMHSKLYK